MTGTSIDALDCALVQARGHGLAITAQLHAALTVDLGPLRQPLKDLASQAPMTAGQVAQLSHDFTLLHARAVRDLLAKVRHQPTDLALVCPHGQTVFHKPPVSWQLINLPLLASELGVTVVGDLRAADLAAGGQGAPITPIADWLTLRDQRSGDQGGAWRVVANLGGFCNATIVPPGTTTPQSVRGLDVCACNLLLDAIAWRVMGQPYDAGGSAALTAEPHADALDDLLGVLTAQRAPSAQAKSLGTGDEATAWIARHWRGGAGCSGATLAATACEAIAQTLAAALQDAIHHALAHDAPPALPELLLAGGGVHNQALTRAIASACTARVSTTSSFGIPAPYREAIAFALLGLLCSDRVPITLPGVTGATPGAGGLGPVAGVWAVPGAVTSAPLGLPHAGTFTR
jgi:1,6-anhydro-N-acetylmuramate kinase